MSILFIKINIYKNLTYNKNIVLFFTRIIIFIYDEKGNIYVIIEDKNSWI